MSDIPNLCGDENRGGRDLETKRQKISQRRATRTMSSLIALPEDDDEPRHSSAAQSISITVLGDEFAPEYTHQSFDGEWIRGYRPHSISGTHRSHANHELASHELDIAVTLAPSCQMCHVDLNIRKKQAESPKAERPRKKRKLSTVSEIDVDHQRDTAESSYDEDDEDYSEQEQEKEETEDDHSDAGSTRHRRMHPDEILERVGRGLPKISNNQKEFVEDDFLRQPVGKTLKTYSRKIGNKTNEYVLTLADSSQAAEYHEQVQNLALFFIESADGVKLSSNNGGGYWKAMYLFQKHGTRRYALCGYMTLFHFHAPFRKPKPGIIVRVCQALLLPPYQRMGHGRVMMRAVHDMTAGSDIVEVNVEDPAPAFTLLRNRVDYELLVESLDTNEPWLPSKYIKEGSFLTISEKDLTKAASLGRITTRQVLIAYELHKLQCLPKEEDEALEKKYRLMVKKRLLKRHREDVGACKTKEERQALLADIWKEVFTDYKCILRR